MSAKRPGGLSKFPATTITPGFLDVFRQHVMQILPKCLLGTGRAADQRKGKRRNSEEITPCSGRDVHDV